MMYRPFLTLTLLCVLTFSAAAQTEQELKDLKAQKQTELGALESQVAALKGEIASIDQQLLVFPRWETGVFGIVGANLNGFNDWLSRDQPNSSSIVLILQRECFCELFHPEDLLEKWWKPECRFCKIEGKRPRWQYCGGDGAEVPGRCQRFFSFWV